MISQTTHNIDEKAIANFEKIASQWWNLSGKSRLLHRINLLRLDYIARRSRSLFGKKILDVGCGGGILTESLAREGAIVTGIDVGCKLLQIARLHAFESNVQIDYIHETVEEHATKYHHQYDIITCMEILEHVPNPQSIIKSCAKLVKPSGEVFFSTINRNKKAWLIAIIFAEYVLCMIPKGTHNIRKFIKPAELLCWTDQTCLEEQHIIGLHYNPFTTKFYFGPDVSVNYILHTRAKR